MSCHELRLGTSLNRGSPTKRARCTRGTSESERRSNCRSESASCPSVAICLVASCCGAALPPRAVSAICTAAEQLASEHRRRCRRQNRSTLHAWARTRKSTRACLRPKGSPGAPFPVRTLASIKASSRSVAIAGSLKGTTALCIMYTTMGKVIAWRNCMWQSAPRSHSICTFLRLLCLCA